MANPNPYDDFKYIDAVEAVNSAIDKLWAAGASEEDMDDVINAAVKNAVRDDG